MGLAENGACIALVTLSILAVSLVASLVWATNLEWYYILVILFVYVNVAVTITRYFASGAFYGVLSRRDLVCEMWQRRMDQFIFNGVEETFLTPLAIVTGANSGVGYVTAETLVQCGFKVIMACRNVKAAEEARRKIIQSVDERIRARYREAFEDAPDRPSSVPSTHDWEGVKKRAMGLLVAAPTNIKVIPLDLGDFKSIDAFVRIVSDEHFAGVNNTTSKSRSEAMAAFWGSNDVVPDVFSLQCFHDGLRVLVNNAGMYDPTYGKVPSLVGVEGLIGVNYLGPTYLTHKLLMNLKGTGLATTTSHESSPYGTGNSVPLISQELPLRVVNLSSVAHTWALNETESGDDADCTAKLLKVLDVVGDDTQSPSNNLTLKRYIKNTYGLSKTGHIALTVALTHLPKELAISSFSLHPGAVRTSVFRSAPRAVQLVIESVGLLLFKTAMEGAALQIFLSIGNIEQPPTFADALSIDVMKAALLPQTLFSETCPKEYPIIPNATHHTDGGAATNPRTGLISKEASNEKAMLAMHRWAMEKILRHH